jgi:nucleotide-binding universal stress UspA family protein
MTFKSLMVHLELGGDNAGQLKVTGDLAERFKANVIGIAACQPIRPIYEEGFVAGDILTQDRAEISKELATVEAQFREALKGKAAGLEWRSTITYDSLADYVAEQARAADLIITGRDIGGALTDNTRRVHIGDLAMRAGKPILIVPQGISALSLNHVFVGWKDARESRRAAQDALPLLKAAAHVTVLEVTADDHVRHAKAHVHDVAAWLKTHQITGEPVAISAPKMEASGLHKALREGKCDLLVAGAYGHNRLSEWVFGGVTQDILLDPDYCVLISH